MADPRDELYALARAALLEVTRDDTIGAPADVIDEGDGVSTVQFENTLPGYPGWRWTVSIASVEGAAPTVLETELIPGDGALLAPDWVPWAERLAEYEASQEAANAAGGGSDEAGGGSGSGSGSDSDDELDDDDESDDDEFDDDDESDDDDDSDDGDDGDDEFDGVDVEEAAEAAGLDGSGDDDESQGDEAEGD